MDKATREATILPGRTQVGFDADKIRREVTEKQLQSYFGTTRPELNPNDVTLAKVQAKVRSMLAMDDKQLENLRKK